MWRIAAAETPEDSFIIIFTPDSKNTYENLSRFEKCAFFRIKLEPCDAPGSNILL